MPHHWSRMGNHKTQDKLANVSSAHSGKPGSCGRRRLLAWVTSRHNKSDHPSNSAWDLPTASDRYRWLLRLATERSEVTCRSISDLYFILRGLWSIRCRDGV